MMTCTGGKLRRQVWSAGRLSLTIRQPLWVIFVSSPREKEIGDERNGQGRKRKMNESKETKEVKTFSLDPYLLQE